MNQKLYNMTLRMLQKLDPETAHHILLKALEYKFLAPQAKLPERGYRLFNRKVYSPVGLAAGANKNGVALAGLHKIGFGLVEIGTVCPDPRTGNALPKRVKRYPAHKAVINAMGLPGIGYKAVLENLQAFNQQPERETMCLGMSLAVPDATPSDGLKKLELMAIEFAPYVDYFTLNASCPNVKHSAEDLSSQQVAAVVKGTKKVTSRGWYQGNGHFKALETDAIDRAQMMHDHTIQQNPHLDRLRHTSKEGLGKPVLVKLAPTLDADTLRYTADKLIAAGASGFVATNTVPFTMRDTLLTGYLEWLKDNNGAPIGGFSGPQTLHTSTSMVYTLRQHVGADMPIIGVGGIQSGAHVTEMIDAGANMTQVYTGFAYRGIELIEEIAQDVANYKGSNRHHHCVML